MHVVADSKTTMKNSILLLLREDRYFFLSKFLNNKKLKLNTVNKKNNRIKKLMI